MVLAPWVCRSCLRPLARRPLIQLVRKASTDAEAVPSLPNALLRRAQKLAAEHDQLKTMLAANFDAKTAKRVGELSTVAAALKQWEAARTSLTELQGLAQSDDAELRELAQDDLESTREQLDSLRHNLSATLTPRHPFAEMPCLIEIRPGPGGVEGRLFAAELVAMYQQYCSNKGYRVRVVKHETENGMDGETALQEAVLEVQDPGAYARFRGEAGIHRVQRVPVTEKSGRTHTSAAAVWVLPSFPENGNGNGNGGGGGGDDGAADFDDPESDFYINVTDVRSETMRARGAGGQHVNKTESAIRLTHMPTGITVSMQDSRSQQRNREYAWRLLRSRLAQQRREEREEAARNLRSSVLAKAQVTRGDKIRTYNYSQNRCTDHRSGLDVYNVPDVLQGGDSLDRLFGSVARWFAEKDIQAVIAEEEAVAASQGRARRSE